MIILTSMTLEISYHQINNSKWNRQMQLLTPVGIDIDIVIAPGLIVIALGLMAADIAEHITGGEIAIIGHIAQGGFTGELIARDMAARGVHTGGLP